jgi:glycosyltransferase involved in cell wall biosynthesis
VKILFVSDVSISSLIGGAERVLYEQSTRLARKGHSVHILTRKLASHEKHQEIIKGVTEWRYDCHQKKSISFLKNSWMGAKKLFEGLQQNYDFDCVNFHQPFSALGVINSSLSRNLGKIYTCHSLSFEEYISRNEKVGGIRKKILFFLNILGRKWIEKKVIKKSNAIITLSNFTSQKLLKIHKINSKKITNIPGGVDLKRFNIYGNKFEIRKNLSVPSDSVVLFTVRNLVNRMGLENLIFSLKNIVNNAPQVYLVIGGDGPLKEDLITLSNHLGVQDFIRFAGYIPEEKLHLYYQMADLFVLPTKELEGFGLVTLEAMASGLPVLGTPVGGTKEIIGKFDSTFLFDNTSPDSMSKSIIETYHLIKQNPRKWREISNQCRQFIEANYSWEKNIELLEEIFFKTSANLEQNTFT